MKRKILSALAAVTALVLASCSMISSNDSDDDKPEGKSAYITVGVDSSRTALPSVSTAAEFEKFTLTGTSQTQDAVAVNGEWTKDESTAAYDKMKAKARLKSRFQFQMQ